MIFRELSKRHDGTDEVWPGAQYLGGLSWFLDLGAAFVHPMDGLGQRVWVLGGTWGKSQKYLIDASILTHPVKRQPLTISCLLILHLTWKRAGAMTGALLP